MASDRLARNVRQLRTTADSPAAPGSSVFWYTDSFETCQGIGPKLAEQTSLSVFTGGSEGVTETVTRTFSQCLSDSVADPRILRLLHVDFDSIDYGKAIFIGSDVADRRGIPGRVPYLYLVIEGGPGTEHEAAVVTFQGVTLVPVGRSGGRAAQL